MKRILCIVSGMNAGGAETFLMKMLRSVDRSEYMLDFCVTTPENYYAEEIEALGGRIFVIPPKSRHPIASFRALRDLVKREGYVNVIRVNEHSLATIDLLAAKKGGATHLVMRSSNASSPSRLGRILHRTFRFLPKRIPTLKLAPSTEAAEYTFGKGCVARGEARLLHNAVDTAVYRYDGEAREAVRRELGVEHATVIGHVGRFNEQKNHAFLLDIFRAIKEKRENAVLVLVGKGELEGAIREKAEALGILDSIVFTGVRRDVPRILSAMDVFVFPSFYEGMPNTVIEAQATGLPVVMSDTITPEADITGLVKTLALSGDPAQWADEALLSADVPREATADTEDAFRTNCYNIESVAALFSEICFR